MRLLVLLCVVWGAFVDGQELSVVKIFPWNANPVKFFEKGANNVTHIVVRAKDLLGRPSDICYRYDLKAEHVDGVVAVDNITVITTDSQGNTYMVGTGDNDTLYSSNITDSGFTLHILANGLPRVSKLFTDNAGNLYIATEQGVRLLRPNGEMTNILDLGPQIDYVTEDSQGNVFMSQGEGNLAVLTAEELSKTIPTVRFVNGLSGVTSLLRGDEDDIFVGTQTALMMLRALEMVYLYSWIGGVEDIVHMHHPNFTLTYSTLNLVVIFRRYSWSLVCRSDASIVKIKALRHPGLAVATNASSVIFYPGTNNNDNECEKITYAGWPNGQAVHDILQDDADNVYVLADDLFLLYDDGNVTKITGLPNGVKKAVVYEDHVFIAAREGLFRY